MNKARPLAMLARVGGRRRVARKGAGCIPNMVIKTQDDSVAREQNRQVNRTMGNGRLTLCVACWCLERRSSGHLLPVRIVSTRSAALGPGAQLAQLAGADSGSLVGYAGRDMVFPQWVLGPYRGMLRLRSIKSGRVFVLQRTLRKCSATHASLLLSGRWNSFVSSMGTPVFAQPCCNAHGGD